MNIKVLMLGDVVGSAGVDYLSNGGRLRRFADKIGASLVIVNGENSAEGNGISSTSFRRLLDAGADVITGGNHTWRKRDVYPILEDALNAVRPANYPDAAPGCGSLIVNVEGVRVLICNLLGQVFMESVNSPFERFEKILSDFRGSFDAAIVDFHAEATSEKLAFARYFDGRVSVVAGTHTHIATADCRVLKGGTGYITDLGMCGSQDGILGVKSECILHKFTEKTPMRFEPAEGGEEANGAVFEIDASSGLCVGAERVSF